LGGGYAAGGGLCEAFGLGALGAFAGVALGT
jgi:hypothetical protein